MGFVEDFFNTLQLYNETFLPITVLTYILGIIIVYLSFKKSKQSSQIASLLLGFLWIWSAIVFFFIYFGPMDIEFLGFTLPGVWYLGGVLYLYQGILFLFFGLVKPSLSFGLTWDTYSILGITLVIYSMLIYPAIGFLTGLNYPRYPVFGAPCPLNIFTLGFLLTANRKTPLIIAVISFIWAIMGIMPILVLSVFADIGLILSGVIGLPLIIIHNRRLG
ncbi:MAG: hypothetical protein JSV51_03325 [Candidatus Bathyarchaeota archaeon]|nr:MAG: hypothetical protein JSV51_03325 [Candidatus Bathyarchaeota archaeon]